MTVTKEQLEQATILYYEGGDSPLTDAEYDYGMATLMPGVEPIELYITLRKNEEGGLKVNLVKPMLSLTKKREEKELSDWVDDMADAGATHLRLSPKWDGLAVQVVKKNGVIISATTRGTGTVGTNVTRMFSHIPKVEEIPDGVTSVEVVLPEESMKSIPQEAGYTTTRNAAAGILRRTDDESLNLAKMLQFRPHWENYGDEYLLPIRETIPVDDYNTYVQTRMADNKEVVDTDGVVIIAENSEGPLEHLGYSNTAPRYAVAWKFETIGKPAVISHVTWNINRTKKSPIAHFSTPVELGGATISKASLHNIDIINDKNIAIGDTVLVVRSNEVIPYVQAVLHRPENRETITEPCEQANTLETSLKHIRDVFTIKNMGDKLLENLTPEAEKVIGTTPTMEETLNYITGLDKETLLGLPRMGEKSADRVLTSIEFATRPSIGQHMWLAALGILTLGRRKFKEILSHTSGAKNLITVIEKNEAETIPGVGPKQAELLAKNLGDIKNMVRHMNTLGVPAPENTPGTTEEEVSGEIVITGALPGTTRKELEGILETHGMVLGKRVTKATTALINFSGKESTKTKTAEKNNTPIHTPKTKEEFTTLVKTMSRRDETDSNN